MFLFSCYNFETICFDDYVIFFLSFFLFVCISFIQIRNGSCGIKNKSESNISSINTINGRCDATNSDFYIKQLKNFIAKNSHESFNCGHYQRQSIQIDDRDQQQYQQYHQSTILSNNLKSRSQSKDIGRKCKRIVYKFMKGLLDERKFKKGKTLKDEPIYFEVSLDSSFICFFLFFNSEIPFSVLLSLRLFTCRGIVSVLILYVHIFLGYMKMDL